MQNNTASSTYSPAALTAQSYYNTETIDCIYAMIWGGEHIHYGIYERSDEPIHDAAQRTVDTMIQQLPPITPASRIIDLGAGYGGTARYLASAYGCRVVCLNISEVQNQRNEQLNKEQRLDELVTVQAGSFEDIPFPDNSFDIVWSQDAFLHSSNRAKVMEEVARVLKKGGELIFTDPMQSPECPHGTLQAALDRLNIKKIASLEFYRDTLRNLGFQERGFTDLSAHVPTHYTRFGETLRQQYEGAVRATSQEVVEKNLSSIEPWIEYYRKGYMQWGILHFHQL